MVPVWVTPVLLSVRQLSALPLKVATRESASGSHFAYAPGVAEPWTAWAAMVSGSDCQPGTLASAS